MTFRARLMPRAEQDAWQIFYWIAERSPEGATRWREALATALLKLSVDPHGYGLAPEAELTEFKLQQFLFKTRRGKTYRGVFVIIEDEVRILRIRGPGQAPLSSDDFE